MESAVNQKNFNHNSPHHPMFSIPETPLHHTIDSSFKASHKHHDTELSIFDAHKYFSETSDIINKPKPEKSNDFTNNVPRYSSVSSARSFNNTPTASSEASWNSRTGLLTKPPGSIEISLKNFPSNHEGKKRGNYSKKWCFSATKSCCLGKKSVLVKEEDSFTTENLTKVQSPENSLALAGQSFRRVSANGKPFIDTIGRFSFPISNNDSPPKEAPRKSLEVFRAIIEMYNPGRVRLNPGSPIARVTNADDESGSDASSDLFEIESLSTPISAFARNAEFDMKSVDAPSVAASECYPPSEVSIDWSVVTAEGFEKASMVTNFSVSASEIGSGVLKERREEGGGDGGKRKGNGLLMMGCRQEKAVSVGPQPVRRAAEGPPFVTVHEAARPPRSNKPPSGGSNAARL